MLKQWIEAPLYTLYWSFKNIPRKAPLLFYCFLVILKALFSFIPWYLNFSDLPSHGSNSEIWYTLWLLLMCLWRSPPPPPFDSLFSSLRWASFSLVVHLCSRWCKIYTETGSWSQKSHDKFEQPQTSSEKSKKLKFAALLLSKNLTPSAETLQRIYLTWLSSISLKITYVIFEAIIYFSQHNFSVFFQLKHSILLTKVTHQSADFQIFHSSG